MKTKLSLIIVIIVSTFSLFGQKEQVNQIDSKGKMQGRWIEYLNNNWKILKDSSIATYCRYNYYEHGISIYPMANKMRLNYKLDFAGNNNQQNSKIKMLDGEYKWLDKKGRTLSIDQFKNGEWVISKNYSWHYGDTWLGELFGYRQKLSGKLHEFYDFTKQYNNQLHTYYIEIYDESGVVKTYYFRQDSYGWCAYEEPNKH